MMSKSFTLQTLVAKLSNLKTSCRERPMRMADHPGRGGGVPDSRRAKDKSAIFKAIIVRPKSASGTVYEIPSTVGLCDKIK